MAHWVGAASYAGVAEEKKERKRDRDNDDSDNDDIMGEAAIALPGGLARIPRAAPPAAAAAAGRAIPLDSDSDDDAALHAGGDQEDAGNGEIPASLLDGDDHFSDDEDTKAQMRAAPRGQPLWCFARHFGKFLTEDSPIVEQLKSFQEQYGNGDLSPGDLARNIQKFYNEEVFPGMPDNMKRRWPLCTIKDWLEVSATEEAQRKNLSRMAFKKLCIIGEQQMCTMDPVTRKLKDRPDDDVRFHQFARTWMQLQKRR